MRLFEIGKQKFWGVFDVPHFGQIPGDCRKMPQVTAASARVV
jgi:hypothetical protein